VYDVGFLVHPEFVEPQNQRFLASHIGRWLRRTDGVLTISDHAKAEIVEHCQLDPSRVHVIYNGVDTAPYANTRKDQIAAVKAKHDIQGDYLLFVGNIEPRKNITRLIEAYTQLPEEQRDRYELLLVGGDGWNNQPILRAIAAAQQKGFRIRKLPTFVSNKELPALYAGATVLTSPSLYEGFGMTPLEAMAAGTPVVVGDNSSLPEVVGEAGLYSDATDAGDISAKIKLLLQDADLRHDLSRRGKKRARSFPWAHTVRQLGHVMERLT